MRLRKIGILDIFRYFLVGLLLNERDKLPLGYQKHMIW